MASIDLYCDVCGNELGVSISYNRNRVEIEPCDKCIEQAKQDGYNERKSEEN